ncbi:MAG: secretin N-terminal domain-containing protein [Candidatus Babeliales bacterium]|nr:secretin N-terminal domain-containing protein [Candidatus Babeliales bacterium]
MTKKVLLLSLIIAISMPFVIAAIDAVDQPTAGVTENKNSIAPDAAPEIPATNNVALEDSISTKNGTKSDNFLTNKLIPQSGTDKQSKSKNAPTQDATISMKYDQEDLVDIINKLAGLKNVNVMLPQGANAIAQKVTLHWPEKFTIDKAWDRLYTILTIAGYTLIPEPNMYVIKKDSPEIARDALPMYIGTPVQELPNSDERIRYVYYLSNIKLIDDPSSEVSVILTNLLPATTSLFKIDTTNNGLIISAKSNDIRAAMNIIVSLDSVDFNETLEAVNLRYTTAKTIADLFNDKILKSGTDIVNKYHLSAKQQTEMTFFSKQTRLISEDRTNTLFILGRPQATQRLKEFIMKNIDVQLDAGRSILHVYQLQYSDATAVATVINSIISSAAQGGSGQSRPGGLNATGSFMTLDPDIKIMADTPSGDSPTGSSGGNKIIVAARQADWKMIEKLIVELDQPRPQVFLEVLICDMTTDDQRLIGSMLRDPSKLPLPGTAQFQALNIGNNTAAIQTTQGSTTAPAVTPTGAAILSDGPTTIANTTNLQSNLLQPYYSVAGGANVSVDQLLTQDTINSTLVGGIPGSTMISMNDPNGSTWGLLQILQSFDSTEIISHPHIIAINNQKALVSVGEQRVLPDEAVGSGGTTTSAKFKQINANLTVEITPRISSANTVQMQISIGVNQFLSTSSNNPPQSVRTVVTNALVKDKDILALGGLLQVNTTQSINATPILSKIPILGYLFKSRFNDVTKSNITIFISPTIIMPRLHGGASERTKEHIQLAKQYAQQGELFDSLQDPITRWFFKTDDDAPNILDDFVERDEILTQQKKKNRRAARKKKLAKKPQPTIAAQNNNSPVEKKPEQKDLKEIVGNDANPLLKP